MNKSKKTRSRDAQDLSSHIHDRAELIRRVFLLLKPSEIKAMAPKFAKKLPLKKLKALCLDEVTKMSTSSLQMLLSDSSAQGSTILIDDSDTDNSLTSSSDSEVSYSDINSTDEGDSKQMKESSNNSDSDVLLVDDDTNRDDHTDFIESNQQRSIDKESFQKVERDTDPSAHIIDGNHGKADQYEDKIKRLDKLTAKLDQEIMKLSKLKKTRSQHADVGYVNEVLSELTSIENEIYNQNMEDRSKSAKVLHSAVPILSQATLTNIDKSGDARKSHKRKGGADETPCKKRISDHLTLTDNLVDSCGKELIKSSNSTKAEASNTTVRSVSDSDKSLSLETTVCLLSDSDESQNELDCELQKSITESRTRNILHKEKQKHLQSNLEKIHIDKRKISFSEQDIEIEIVVDGGPNQDNKSKNLNHTEESMKTKKHSDIGKKYYKTSSDSIGNDMLTQIDAAKNKFPDEGIADHITIITSSGTDDSDSDKNTAAREEGEIDSASDNRDGEADKRQKRRRRVMRISNKKDDHEGVTHKKDNQVIINENTDVPINNSAESKEGMTPLVRSSVLKVTDNDKWLTENNCSKIKSVAAKVPQNNDSIKKYVGDSNIKKRMVLNDNATSYGKPKEMDSITVVVQNTSENETNEMNKTIKMNKGMKSLESIVIPMKNKDRSLRLSNADHHRLLESHKHSLKPVDQKYIAKASNSGFVDNKDRGKPVLMAQESSVQIKMEHNMEPWDSVSTNKTMVNKTTENTHKTLCNQVDEDIILLTDNDTELLMDTGELNIRVSDISKTSKADGKFMSDGLDALPLKKKENYNMLSKKDEDKMVSAAAVEDITDTPKHRNMSVSTRFASHPPHNIGPMQDVVESVKIELVEIHEPTIEDSNSDATKVGSQLGLNSLQSLQYKNRSAEPSQYFKNSVDTMVTNKIDEKCSETSINYENHVDSGIDTTINETLLDLEIPLQQNKLLIDRANRNVDILRDSIKSESKASTNATNDTLEDGEIDAAVESAGNFLEEGEVTGSSSSDVESVGIPNEIICISDEEPDSRTGLIGVDTVTIRKKKGKKRKKHMKHKKCKQKIQSHCKEADTMLSRVVQSDCKDKNAGLESYSESNSDLAINAVCAKTPEGKSVLEICDKKITEYAQIMSGKDSSGNVIGADVRVISSDPEDIEMTENGPMLSLTRTMSPDRKKSSQYDIDTLSIETSSDETTDEPIFEDLDVLRSIDGIENQQVATQRHLDEGDDMVHTSWRDRYLESTKVKTVLSTSNILNTLRKKYRGLKKNMLVSKQAHNTRVKTPEPSPVNINLEIDVEEGSIEHYNILQSSIKFVDSRPDPNEVKETNSQKDAEHTATHPTEKQTTSQGAEESLIGTDVAEPTARPNKEMKNDAKNLLKMYKKLLKYNDLNHPDKPHKKKKNKGKQCVLEK